MTMNKHQTYGRIGMAIDLNNREREKEKKKPKNCQQHALKCAQTNSLQFSFSKKDFELG